MTRPTIARRSVLHQMLLADPLTPALVRHTIARWLADRGVAAEHRDDLVLAVNEAVTNVIDHAYRGSGSDDGWDRPDSLQLEVRLSDESDGSRWAIVTVTDHGSWRPSDGDAGFRGRGLDMMRACTDWQRVEPSDEGTRVYMGRRVG